MHILTAPHINFVFHVVVSYFSLHSDFRIMWCLFLYSFFSVSISLLYSVSINSVEYMRWRRIIMTRRTQCWWTHRQHRFTFCGYRSVYSYRSFDRTKTASNIISATVANWREKRKKAEENKTRVNKMRASPDVQHKQ